MNAYQVNYKIKSKADSKYILISDIHGNFDERIANYIRDIEDINYVVISGDLLNGNQWENKDKLQQVKRFIDIISENKKVVIGLGNHDLWGLTLDGFHNYRDLETKQVCPLYNDTQEMGVHRFTNFVPSSKSYSYPKQEQQRTIDSILEQYYNCNYKHNNNSEFIEHLLSHNPFHFYHNEVMSLISKDYDLIETGHFHDGWIPTAYLDKHYPTLKDKGVQELIRSQMFDADANSLHVKPKRNLSRGVVYNFKEGYYVLLPNGAIYYYDKAKNLYKPSNANSLDNRLEIDKVPAIVISGSLNTFLKLPIFYPYITTVECTKDEEHSANRLIRKI